MVPTEMLTKEDQRPGQTPALPTVPREEDQFDAAARRQAKRVRRLKIHVAAWVVGAALITGLWVLNQWQAHGAFRHFGSHEGNPGDWNPTLWALGVGLWGLVVGIMALRVHFERPTSQVELEREVDRMRLGGAAKGAQAVGGLRRIARRRLERIGRLKFHVAAWALSMVVLSPLWALIEWQDNGGFERFSDNGKPGSWEAWIFYVGGIWALVIVFFALYVYLARPETDAAIERVVRLLRSRRWRKEA